MFSLLQIAQEVDTVNHYSFSWRQLVKKFNVKTWCVEELQQSWSCWRWRTIINLQNKKMVSSQDGSQCERCWKRKNWKKEGVKGLFFKLAGVHSQIVLFLFLFHGSALHIPSFPVPVVKNLERVKLRAAFSHQHQTRHTPRPLTLLLLSQRWRKRPVASQNWQSKSWEKMMPKREGRVRHQRLHCAHRTFYWDPK